MTVPYTNPWQPGPTGAALFSYPAVPDAPQQAASQAAADLHEPMVPSPARRPSTQPIPIALSVPVGFSPNKTAATLQLQRPAAPVPSVQPVVLHTSLRTYALLASNEKTSTLTINTRRQKLYLIAPLQSRVETMHGLNPTQLESLVRQICGRNVEWERQLTALHALTRCPPTQAGAVVFGGVLALAQRTPTQSASPLKLVSAILQAPTTLHASLTFLLGDLLSAVYAMRPMRARSLSSDGLAAWVPQLTQLLQTKANLSTLISRLQLSMAITHWIGGSWCQIGVWLGELISVNANVCAALRRYIALHLNNPPREENVLMVLRMLEFVEPIRWREAIAELLAPTTCPMTNRPAQARRKFLAPSGRRLSTSA
jgi:hypothetical protein